MHFMTRVYVNAMMFIQEFLVMYILDYVILDVLMDAVDQLKRTASHVSTLLIEIQILECVSVSKVDLE